MSKRDAYHHWKMLTLAVSILLLSACSANRLAYNNLDWLISWKVGDYISLDRDQKRWLAAQTKQQLAWHCGAELPSYLPLLDELESSLHEDNLDAAILLAGMPPAEAAVDRLLVQMAPTISGLLRQLNDQQVQELKASLQEKHAELEEKYTGPDLPTQQRERVERAEERLEDWLGPIGRQQYARLESWAAELQGHNQIWLENRQVWQQAFLAALGNRAEAGFDQQILALLIDRQRYWTPEFENVAKANRQQGAYLLADLVRLADNRQKAHLARRFDSLRADIHALQCAAT